MEKRLVGRMLVLLLFHKYSLPIGNISEDLNISSATVKNIIKNDSGKILAVEVWMFQ